MSKHEERPTGDMRRELRGFDPDRLRIARTSARYSKSEMARLSQVAISTYNQWESGKSSPRVDSLARCAKVLGLKMSDLVVVDLRASFLGDLRVTRGLIQAELAQRMGVSTQLVGLLERGQGALTTEMSFKFSEALEYSLEQIVASYERSRNRPPHVHP